MKSRNRENEGSRRFKSSSLHQAVVVKRALSPSVSRPTNSTLTSLRTNPRTVYLRRTGLAKLAAAEHEPLFRLSPVRFFAGSTLRLQTAWRRWKCESRFKTEIPL